MNINKSNNQDNLNNIIDQELLSIVAKDAEYNDIKRINSKPIKLRKMKTDRNIYINTNITEEVFKSLLLYYENNQMYYSRKGDYSISKYKSKLQELEDWFLQVVEPRPDNDSEILEWAEREKTKQKGYTWYCDHKIRKYLEINIEVKEQVEHNYLKVVVPNV